MHLFFSGIGGTGIGPLALIAKHAGYVVSGSDKQDSDYIKYLQKQGIDSINIGQDGEYVSKIHERQPIDWFVYSSSLILENPKHPELEFCKRNNIKTTKRADLINHILEDKQLKMIAVAGTHGKSTTTAMLVWCFKQLGIPISYSVGAKLDFGDMGEYATDSEYFVYEADEFDRNFLEFHPAVSLITGIAYDHPDIYPTRKSYYQAFVDFINQSEKVYGHSEDFERIGIKKESESVGLEGLNLVGEVNRKNAQIVIDTIHGLTGHDADKLIKIMNDFPGLSRRFEEIVPNIYSDYAHTPEKIRGAIQTALEVNNNVVVVYEGLHNTRQHFIKSDLTNLFEGVKKVYVVPSYLAREDKNLEMLTPEKLVKIIQTPPGAKPMRLGSDLRKTLVEDSKDNLVLCLTAGGGGSLDEWLRKEFRK